MKVYLFIALVSVIVCGCSSIDTGRIAPGYVEAFKAINNALFGYEDLIDKELVDKIPYASITLKIGKGPQGLLILESVKDNQYTWLSADNVFLVIKNGRLIRTQGLSNNLNKLIYPNSSLKLSEIDQKNNYLHYYSYDRPVLINLKTEASYSSKGLQKVKLLSGYRDLFLIEEYIKNDYLGWEFTNKYWVDEGKFVWKSEQFVSPKLPKFFIEVTKKPSK